MNTIIMPRNHELGSNNSKFKINVLWQLIFQFAQEILKSFLVFICFLVLTFLLEENKKLFVMISAEYISYVLMVI